MTRKTLFLLMIMLTAACSPQAAAPYAPLNASDSHGGVTATVLNVTPREQSTAVNLRVAWPDANWDFYWSMPEQGPHLRDNNGHEYETVADTPAGGAVTVAVTRVVVNTDEKPTPDPTGDADERVFTFAPILPTAETLTLQIDALEFDAEAEGSFSVDLGTAPQVGERWPLDVTLDVAGFPVRVTAVHLTEPEERALSDRTWCCRLTFDLEVEQETDRLLNGLLLDVDSPRYRGESGRYTSGALRPSITVETLPDSPFIVTLDRASILVPGPLHITWPIPEA